MMTSTTTVAFCGVEPNLVDVQVQITPGLPAFTIVGLPDKAVAESRERVRNALHACGLALPLKRITINLAPADLPKEGSHFDLPIALGLMAAIGAVPSDALTGFLVIGELALDGRILPTQGVLPSAVTANRHDLGLICPEQSGPEAAWADEEMNILAPGDLISLHNHFQGTQVLDRPAVQVPAAQTSEDDLADVKGQELARRALEIAAAGGHNLLLIGPPGAGKSLLARCLPSILPPLSAVERLNVSMIASLAGILPRGGVCTERPFRSPHHSASVAALVGGGRPTRPGEVTLAHHGVLFLDELPEFTPVALNSLRQPLETGEAVVARANHHMSFPARFQLVAAMNPCRCGYAGDPDRACRMAPRCAESYQMRISGPLLDRLDMTVELPAVSAHTLFDRKSMENSQSVASRVQLARNIQTLRFQGSQTNATGGSGNLDEYLNIRRSALAMLESASSHLQLSARGLHRIIRVARTIADLVSCESVDDNHMAEALSFRPRHSEPSPVG